jgi:hypothetical protein
MVVLLITKINSTNDRHYHTQRQSVRERVHRTVLRTGELLVVWLVYYHVYD